MCDGIDVRFAIKLRYGDVEIENKGIPVKVGVNLSYVITASFDLDEEPGSEALLNLLADLVDNRICAVGQVESDDIDSLEVSVGVSNAIDCEISYDLKEKVADVIEKLRLDSGGISCENIAKIEIIGISNTLTNIDIIAV